MKYLMPVILILTIGLSCNAQNDSIRRMMKNVKDPKRLVPLEVVQKAIEINLDSIRYLDFDIIFIKKDMALKSNPKIQKFLFYNYFSERAKQRMTELFEGKWTEDEIENRLNASIESTLDTLNPRNGYYRQAKTIAKRDSLPLQQVWDSMIVARKEEWRQDLFLSSYVPKPVVLIAGYLKTPRFQSYLKKMEEDNEGNVDKNIELALARYGVEPYHTNAVKRYAYAPNNWNTDVSKLMYICSKEAIEEIYNYIMKEDKQICDSNGVCHGYLAVLEMGALVTLFKSKTMSEEMDALNAEYYQNGKEIDESYLKDMRSIAERYYQKFKWQKPDCEDVPFSAW